MTAWCSSNRFTVYRNTDRSEKSASTGKFSENEKQSLASGKIVIKEIKHIPSAPLKRNQGTNV